MSSSSSSSSIPDHYLVYPFSNFSNEKESLEPFKHIDSRISFDEPSHTYFLDADDESKKKTMSLSVTPLVHAPFESFDPDAAILAIKRSRAWKNNQHEFQNKTDEEIKAVWSGSGLLGTVFHSRAEMYHLKGEIPDFSKLEEYEKKEFLQFLKFNHEFILPRGYRPYRTEWRLLSEELDVCGSSDMMYLNPAGNIVIFDWKRTKDLPRTSYNNKRGAWPLEHLPDSKYWVYSLQLNMYRRMLEQTYGVKVEGMFLVACHEKRDEYLVEEVSVMDEEIQALVRVRKELLKRGITTMSHEDLESVRSSIII